MDKYPIKTPNKDFYFTRGILTIKGTRTKKIVFDTKSRAIAFFKYERDGELNSESCSEKMSYEIAKVLGYDCAKIELARDEEGNLGILNYLFIDISNEEHMDAASYLNVNEKNRAQVYTISNIKKIIDNIDSKLFNGFIRTMVFDALIGEQDRHEENWGIVKKNNEYRFSPLYDNGDNLLKEFKNPDNLLKYSDGIKDFNSYINRSRTLIYKEDNIKKYKHFELIEYLNNKYHNIVQSEIKNLNKLTDEKIEKIVNKIPDNLLTITHKDYIIQYLKKRRDILLSIN